MTPSQMLSWSCIAFVVGIALESFMRIPQIFIWGFLIAGIFALVTAITVNAPFYASTSKRIKAIGSFLIAAGFCLLFFVMGATCLQISESHVANDPIRNFNDAAEKITLMGTVIDNPDQRSNSQRLKVAIDGTDTVLLVTTWRYREYRYLDIITVSGKLKTPVVFEDFNYKDYLLKEGIYSVMDFPEITLIGKSQYKHLLPFLFEQMLLFKKKLQESITSVFSLPQSAILEGILLGNTTTMPQDLKDKFNATGLTHLTAISGSNVVILSTILTSFLIMLGLWRNQALYISAASVWFYVAVAGFPASGIRAAIMGSVLLAAQRLGRQGASSRVIMLAGALMLFNNPFLLRYDIGFQLSFLASMGIIHLKPLMSDFFISHLSVFISHLSVFKIESRKRIMQILDIFSVTISAQIATLPVIAYYFHEISLVAPFANLMIVPAVDWIMALGFAASFIGIFSVFIGMIISFPAWFLLSYFIKIMDIFYQPWATVSLGNISWVFLAAYYGVLAWVIFYWYSRQLPRFL